MAAGSRSENSSLSRGSPPRANLSLRAQRIDPVYDDLAQIMGRQTGRGEERFRAQLRELFIERKQAGANAFVVLQVLPASQDILVDLFETFSQPLGLLSEGLTQMIDIGLDDLLFHRPYLLGDLVFHVLQRLQQTLVRLLFPHKILRQLNSRLAHRNVMLR